MKLIVIFIRSVQLKNIEGLEIVDVRKIEEKQRESELKPNQGML